MPLVLSAARQSALLLVSAALAGGWLLLLWLVSMPGRERHLVQAVQEQRHAAVMDQSLSRTLAQAAAIAHRLGPRWVVPMHYRTHRIGFLETADEFLEKMPNVERLSETGFDTDALDGDGGPRAVVPAVP